RQAARLVLADLSAPRRHLLSLAVEDARQELGIAPPRLPGGVGEVGDFGLLRARRGPFAVRAVALFAILPEKFSVGRCLGRRGCRRGRRRGRRRLGWRSGNGIWGRSRRLGS